MSVLTLFNRRTQKHLVLGEQPVVLGRDPRLAFCLNDPQVSRAHALVEPGPRGACVADLSSTNGVEVNGEPLRRGGRRQLRMGDAILVGGTELVLCTLEDAPGEEPLEGILEALQVC